jgi:hypothetical protein
VSARITVRERISPDITASLFANYRSAADAVMELIDNSIDSRLPKSPLVVDIVLHPTSIIVETLGGSGMGLRDLERRYLQWGGSAKRGRHLLGQYGQGGKAAIGHLGSRFTVEASRPGDARAWRFTDEDYRDRSRLKTYEVDDVPKRVAPEIGYVRIRIDAVDKRVDARRLRQRLGDVYRPLLESGSLEIRLDRRPVVPEPIVALERKPFSINAGGGRSRGWVGISDPAAPMHGWVPGLRCYKLGRLVAEGEFFGHPGPGIASGMVRLMGEIDVSQVPLTMNKSDFERDTRSWIEVEERMHRLLRPLVRRLASETEARPPESAVRVAERVRRLLAQALRLTAASDAFVGFAPAPAGSGNGQERLPLTGGTLEAPKTAVPKVPRAATAGDHVRRGFGLVVVRPLDPSLRSATLLEDGTRVVVINSRHPLFVERRGDIWYQLETAAREVCRLAEPANVTDYERRVNDLVLAALALRGRRRPPSRAASPGRRRGL